MIKGIKVIKETVREIRAKYPNIKAEDLNEHDTIYYTNKNNGTNFDWQVNDRLCEFMVYHKESGMGFIKICVKRDNTMWIYVYPDGEMKPTEEIHKDCGFSAEHLKNIMLKEADRKNKWDKTLHEIFE